MFFKSELLSRRASKQDPLAIRGAITLYGWLSDFGRSFARPLTIWLALIGIFAGIYWLSACALCPGAPGHSLYLSAKNGLVVLGGSKDQRVTDAYLCLYGEQFKPPATLPDPQQRAPAKPMPTGSPDIPGLITLMEFVHAIFSVILLFLVAFGIRNQFRIK